MVICKICAEEKEVANETSLSTCSDCWVNRGWSAENVSNLNQSDFLDAQRTMAAGDVARRDIKKMEEERFKNDRRSS